MLLNYKQVERNFHQILNMHTRKFCAIPAHRLLVCVFIFVVAFVSENACDHGVLLKQICRSRAHPNFLQIIRARKLCPTVNSDFHLHPYTQPKEVRGEASERTDADASRDVATLRNGSISRASRETQTH